VAGLAASGAAHKVINDALAAGSAGVAAGWAYTRTYATLDDCVEANWISTSPEPFGGFVLAVQKKAGCPHSEPALCETIVTLGTLSVVVAASCAKLCASDWGSVEIAVKVWASVGPSHRPMICAW
jgi:hypothetical protein